MKRERIADEGGYTAPVVQATISRNPSFLWLLEEKAEFMFAQEAAAVRALDNMGCIGETSLPWAKVSKGRVK